LYTLSIRGLAARQLYASIIDIFVEIVTPNPSWISSFDSRNLRKVGGFSPDFWSVEGEIAGAGCWVV
jgi:hypothetical protein